MFKKIFDSSVKKLMKNASVLLSGTLGANVLGIITLVIVARDLGASDLGVLTLIQTYTLIIISLLLPKPWIATVKYGTGFINKLQFSRMKSVIKYGFLLELGTALLAFGLVNLIISLFFGHLEYSNYLMIYSFVILFSISGVSVGVLRIYDQFKMLSIIEFGSAFIKLLLILVATFFTQTFLSYLLAYLVGEVSKHVFYLISSCFTMKREGYFKLKAEKLEVLLKENKGIISFTLSTHFNDFLGTVRRNLDVVIIGVILSNEAVGFLRVIKQFGKVFSLLGNPIKQTVYPELCRYWEKREYINYYKFIKKITLIMLVGFGAFILVLTPFLTPLVSLLFTSDFEVITIPLIIYLVSHGFFLSFQTLNSALLSMGKANKVLTIEIATNIAYFIGLFLLGETFGLHGVVSAFFISTIFWIVISYYFFKKYYRESSISSLQEDYV